MKLNHECIREVLLYVEENFKDYTDNTMSYDLPIDGFESDDINYSCLKLYEAGYLNGKTYPDGGMYNEMIVSSITWKGHEFLDNIRTEESWKKTKSIVNKIGSASLTIISETASKIILGLIDKELSKNGLL